MKAILMALQHCWSLGYRQIIMESYILDTTTEQKISNGVGKQISGNQITWANRNANKVSDLLEKQVQRVKYKFHFYVSTIYMVLYL